MLCHRHLIKLLLLALLSCVLTRDSLAQDASFRVATFEADITIPVGHACMGGGIANAKEVVDPLYAKGFVLLGGEQPVVVVALDWCQCNNDSYDRWRDALAEAAGTSRRHVMLATVHQHDAPICDLRAQQLLDEAGLKGSICDPAFHEQAVQRTAAALKASLGKLIPVTHVGAGQAKVERLASNRRVVRADGTVHWGRGSSSGDGESAPEGEIDPFLKTISLWDGDRAVVAWSSFAIHPMSHYGRGLVSADFVGRARALRQAEEPGVFQVYFTGCAGDVTAGKYNDGRPENREVLAERLHAGMKAAWADTRRVPLDRVEFRSAELRLPPRTGGDFEPARMKEILADPTMGRWQRNCAALGLSWRHRTDAGQPIDVPCLDFGPGAAQFMVMPAETFVGYQLAAQKLRPDSFVMVAGFGDGAPGYIPTDQCWRDGYEDAYCWAAPMTDELMTEAMATALAAPAGAGPGAAAPASPPNIVLIVSDDQHYGDFGFMGHPEIKTPHLDRLAAEGAVFPNGYVPSSLCRASLATIITGLYGHQHRICCNDPPAGVDRDAMLPFMREAPALPRLLKEQLGYRSLQTGKWWEGHFSNGGFTDGMTLNGPGGRHGDAGLAIGRETMQPVFDFIDDCRTRDERFLVWYAPMLPHEPHDPPARLLDRYRAPGRDERLAKYWAMCERFDETCGELLDFLDQRKVADDTLVVFVIDNGWIQETGPTKRTAGNVAPKSKRSPYDGGLRTPVILRWPGRLKPGRHEDLVSTIDLAPTVLDAGGLKPTPAMKGVSLLPVATGHEARLPRDAVFGEIFAHTAVDAKEPSLSLTHRWVRTGSLKLIVPEQGAPELYDVASDPSEERDLAAGHAEDVTRLRDRLDQWWSGRAAR